MAHLFPLKMFFAKPWKHMQRRPGGQSLYRRFDLRDFNKDLTSRSGRLSSKFLAFAAVKSGFDNACVVLRDKQEGQWTWSAQLVGAPPLETRSKHKPR